MPTLPPIRLRLCLITTLLLGLCLPGDTSAYTVDVEIVPTANADGSQASSMTQEQAESQISMANAIWARNGGKIQFRLWPHTDFQQPEKHTELNNDCILQPGVTQRSVTAITDPGFDTDALCDSEPPHIARVNFAIERPNRIVVFSRGGNLRLKYIKDDGEDEGHWTLTTSSGGSSPVGSNFIVMPANFSGDSTLLAHELGHYFGLSHTFDDVLKPKDRTEAATMMAEWAADNPSEDPRYAFDRDRHSKNTDAVVFDTPPDPGTGLFNTVFRGNYCSTKNKSVSVSVTIDGETTVQTLTPDRANVMSYFKHCPVFHFHFSKQQLDKTVEALLTGIRSHLHYDSLLGSGGSCYGGSGGGADSGGNRTGWVAPPGLTEEDLKLSLRKLAACLLLMKEPMPWEMVMGDIYINPAELRPGYRQVGELAIDEVLEQQYIDSLLKINPRVE